MPQGDPVRADTPEAAQQKVKGLVNAFPGGVV